jgi:predicted aminopeptidase
MRLFLVLCVLLISLSSISGCALSYYWQAAAGQLELLGQRTPISEVLVDPEQSDATRAVLLRTTQMREFAVTELGLPDNESYRSYADLGRPYVVWNVVAAEEFSVDARRWCFPIAGCVTYRGYFAQEDAERYAENLSAEGLDTYVAGTSAYSTLGYFSDPILNTMLSGGELYIAGVIFHELAHQLFYIPGDTDLNEAFASTVEEYGTQRWLLKEGDDQAVDSYRRRQERREDFFRLIANQQARLREIYQGTGSPDEMRAAKREAFQILVAEYETLRDGWGDSTDYENWFSRPLNNAQIASVAAYSRWLPNLRAYLSEYGLEALYAEMALLEELPDTEREVRLRSYLTTAAFSEHR